MDLIDELIEFERNQGEDVEFLCLDGVMYTDTRGHEDRFMNFDPEKSRFMGWSDNWVLFILEDRGVYFLEWVHRNPSVKYTRVINKS